jgi:hypothetical protein
MSSSETMAKEVSDNNRLKEARLWNVFHTDRYFSSLIGARFPVRRKKKKLILRQAIPFFIVVTSPLNAYY